MTWARRNRSSSESGEGFAEYAASRNTTAARRAQRALAVSRTRSSTRPHGVSQHPRDVGAQVVGSATGPARGAARRGAGLIRNSNGSTPAPSTEDRRATIRVAADWESVWEVAPGSAAFETAEDQPRHVLFRKASASAEVRQLIALGAEPARRWVVQHGIEHHQPFDGSRQAARDVAGDYPVRRSLDKSPCSGGG